MPGTESPRGGRSPGHAEIADQLLVSARWIVPVEPAGAVLEHHAVAIRDGLIEKIVPASEVLPGYERVELPEHTLIPGLVNAHVHAAMALARGSDAPGWPVPPEGLSPDSVRAGTLLACAEMLRGGITCFRDCFFFPEAALEAALRTGIRYVAGLPVLDAASPYASDAADYLRKGLELRDRARENASISFCLAPQSVGEATLRQVATLAAELDLPVHLRLQPGDIARAERARLLGPGFTALCAADVDPADIPLLARHGASVAHCAIAAARRGRSAPLAALRAAGVGLCLGTDAPPANHRFDLLAEMRSTPMSPHDILQAATLGGARALGLAERIGSIVPGKAADLAALAVPPGHLGSAAGPEQVTHVWVGGVRLVDEGNLANSTRSGLSSH